MRKGRIFLIRYEIHLNGFNFSKLVRLTQERIQHKKQLQITRILLLKDPKVK